MAYPLLLWIHMFAAVGWVGGLAFNLLVASVSAREVLGTPRAYHLYQGVVGRHTARAVPLLMVMLLASGIPLLIVAPAGVLDWMKLALFGVMATIYFYVARRIWPRMVFASDAELPILQLRYRQINFVSLGCGTVALLLSAFSRHA